jgi:hypothetical protein
MMRTPQSETRVVPTGPNNGYSADGRWLAQYHDDSMGGPWFDIGDPHDTQAEAILATLPHPDAVGESEYRAVHHVPPRVQVGPSRQPARQRPSRPRSRSGQRRRVH